MLLHSAKQKEATFSPSRGTLHLRETITMEDYVQSRPSLSENSTFRI